MEIIKELLRTLKYVVKASNKVLKLEQTKPKNNMGKLRGICDSAYTPDPETRRSVTGYRIYVMDCLVSWKSQSQKSVNLSSTETEYVAMSELVQEIMFLRQVMEFLGMKIKYPIIINCDNVGDIFIAENATGQ